MEADQVQKLAFPSFHLGHEEFFVIKLLMMMQEMPQGFKSKDKLYLHVYIVLRGVFKILNFAFKQPNKHLTTLQREECCKLYSS